MLTFILLLTAVEGKYMSKYIPGNQKHLTLNDRIYIEESLEQGRSFKDIARYLCKDPTTISKEVKAHRIHEPHFKERLFITKGTSVSIASHVRRPMHAGR